MKSQCVAGRRSHPCPSVVKKQSCLSAPSFAVLHLADFPLQALLRTAPDLAARPVAVLDGERKRALVLACTAAAAAQAVEPGLTAPAALSRCAELQLRQRHPGAEAEATAALLAAAATLSPLYENTAPGLATADLTALPKTQRLPRIQSAVTQLNALGLHATAALAPTPLLARYGAQHLSLSSLSFSFSPRGETPPDHHPILSIESPADFLAPLPLAVAEPTPEHASILALWGVRTLGDLTALPKTDVAQRLGPGGLALWERAAGQTTRPLQPVTPPATFSATLELEFAIETLEPLLFLLRRFTDRLALELTTAALAAASLTLTLTLDNDTTHQRTIRLPEPTASADLLHRTLHSHLETVQTDSPVVAARLDLEPTRSLHRQHGLFDSSLRDPHGFAETLARAAALLGENRIGTPRLTDTHRPDACTLVAPDPAVEPAPPPPALPPLGLPLRRYRPPQPARVELAPATRRPTYVATADLSGPVTALLGPWRSSGDWWQPDRAWTSEDWDIALGPPSPGLYRLTETPTGWYLVGEYD